jgi:hypothetical protein
MNPYLDEDSSVIPENIRFLFDSDDLLETAMSIKDNDVKSNQRDLILGVLKVQLIIPSVLDLNKRFGSAKVD